MKNKRDSNTSGARQFTIDEVKDDLPDVEVRLRDGTIEPGYVKGRMLPFAKVYLCSGLAFEFSWEAVTRSINTGEPLRI